MTPASAYLSQTAAILKHLDLQQIDTMIGYLTRLRDREGRLFVIGNGGGHGAHMAADFRKIARIEAYAWGENVSDLTAYANDLGWAASTTNWLTDSRCGRNDAIFVLSVGGATRELSQNLKEAIFWAKGGPVVLGVVGQNGGYTATHADACIIIPSGHTPHVEGIQAVLWHLLVEQLRD